MTLKAVKPDEKIDDRIFQLLVRYTKFRVREEFYNIQSNNLKIENLERRKNWL